MMGKIGFAIGAALVCYAVFGDTIALGILALRLIFGEH